MITLQTSGDSAVKFVFENSQHYLYGDGEIVVPKNSLILVEDSSDMVTFKKIDGDIFVSANIAEFGMSKSELESWYKDNMVGSTGGGGATYTAGRGIDIDSGNTISFTLPISAGTGNNSIAEGSGTTASGNNSHAEGFSTQASGKNSHAEGWGTIASGNQSHAEGQNTRANGDTSHAEGILSIANDYYSHAEGGRTIANGSCSHAEGFRTETNNEAEHASGQFNVSNSESDEFGDSGNTLFSVGNGTASDARHNAFEIRQNGDIYITSGNTDIKLQDNLGGGISSGECQSMIAEATSGAVGSFGEFEMALDDETGEVYIQLGYGNQEGVGLGAIKFAKYGSGLDQSNGLLTVVGKVNESTFNSYSAATNAALSGKLDTSAYTPVTVSSAVTSGDTNAVAGGAVYDKVTYNKEVPLEFANAYSTNFSEGCTTIKVTMKDKAVDTADIDFHSSSAVVGNYSIMKMMHNISVTNNFTDSTYSISGNVVTITWSSSKGVTKINNNDNHLITAVIEGAWITDNTYMKGEVDAKVATLQSNINTKLDSTAYTPVTVDSVLMNDSTNPVQNKVLFDELRINEGKEPDTVITWDELSSSTNFPSGCTTIEVSVADETSYSISFHDDDNQTVGNYVIHHYGSYTIFNEFSDSTYTTSGNVVTITWPTSKGVTTLQSYDEPTITAIGSDITISVKDSLSGYVQTSAVTTSVTSASTDSQIPTAKAVYDAIPTGGTGGGNPTVELTQAQYDALVSAGTVSADTYYIITDAQPVNLSGYAQTSAVTQEIAEATSGKVDTSAVTTSVTSASTDSQIPTAKAVYDAIPTGGSGSYSAGSGISISNNTISTDLNVYKGQAVASVSLNNSAGNGSGQNSISGTASVGAGFDVQTKNYAEAAFGTSNVSNGMNGSMTKSSGATLFSVGNGSQVTRHNAFEIRQNGDIYITYGADDIKLQDKLDEIEQVIARALNQINDRLTALENA